nr:lysine-specific demethylase JMJ25-like isoform X2 [Tanacetum cinerariifolium]
MTNGESVKDMTTKFDKLVKFEGQDFRRWQKKMHFLLTTLKVVYVLSTPSLEWHEDETLETTRKRMKWENDDYICRGHILNGMDDSLFDIYQNIESAKALWESLESKYMAEDASSKKFLVAGRQKGTVEGALTFDICISFVALKGRKKRKTKASSPKDGNVGDKKGKWCHHGHWSVKSLLVECEKCRSNAFCVVCMAEWYPDLSEEEFIKACPVCCNSCNCKACLRGCSFKDIKRYSCFEPDKIRHSTHILQQVFPLVMNLNEQQQVEKEIEAKVKGLLPSELCLEDAKCGMDDIFCNNCGACFFDLYRSCACGYHMCLVCCRDLRDGQLKLKIGVDGSIPCPPNDTGGCDDGVLKLKRIMPDDWVMNMISNAQGMYITNTRCNKSQTYMECCMCYDENIKLYQCSAKNLEPEDMQHFQLHWSKGEPIIVGDVVSTSSGLSWNPMVLWRAFHDFSNSSSDSDCYTYEVNATKCSDWSEVTLDLYKFFRGYIEAWPMSIKLEEWKPHCLSEEVWPRHFVEFMKCLPFKDYTHPYAGYLNVANKLPDISFKLDMGPRMDIGYGGSITRLRCDKCDTVNVLMHTLTTKLNMKKMAERNPNGLVCEEGMKTNEGEQPVVDPMEGGAMWDIFKRQDVDTLEEYLRNHAVNLVVHPIHDRAFYLTRKHKKKLKEEFGIEPWTIHQKLGDAVFIPAGCPYQVRNLESSTKVEVNFISPESLSECIRLQHELRKLPNNHRAKQDKLDIGKIMIYALDRVVADLTAVTGSNVLHFVERPEMLNGNNTNGWIDETDDEEELLEQPLTMIPLEPVGLWRGHDIGPEVKKLLDAVENRYPDTFSGVRSSQISVPILKQFDVVIKQFLGTSMDALTEERATSLREELKELESLKFEVSWARQKLTTVETLRNQPLGQELAALEESLQVHNEKLFMEMKDFKESYETLKRAKLQLDGVEDARKKKVQEVEQQLGIKYDVGLLKKHLGFGLLPEY